VPQISPLIILKRGNQYNALAVKKVKILMPRTNVLYLPKPKQLIATKAFLGNTVKERIMFVQIVRLEWNSVDVWLRYSHSSILYGDGCLGYITM
jgi:hypothetical protein